MTQARLPYSRRSGPGFGLALALFLCAGMPALAQTGGETVRDGPVPVTADPGPPSARDVLNAELARMRAERAELARFIAWQEKLVRAAKSDPAAALAQRLPMSECRASVLEPICHRLVALFAPHETGAGTSEDETGGAARSGTAASEESQP